MASKQSKRKPQAKTRGRKKNVKLSDLKVAKGAALKGGGGSLKTTSTSSTLPTESVTLSYAKLGIEY